MRRRWRTIILVALVASLGLAAGSLYVRSHLLGNPERFLDELLERADLHLKDIDYTHIVDGRRQWTLKASKVDYVKDQNTFFLKDVLVRFYSDDGRSATVTGREGVYSRKEGWIRIQGQALVKADGGYTAAAESFTYLIKEKKVVTDDAVTLTGPGFTVKGKGLRVEVAEWRGSLLSDVSTVIEPALVKTKRRQGDV